MPSKFGGVAVDEPQQTGSKFGGVPVEDETPKPFGQQRFSMFRDPEPPSDNESLLERIYYAPVRGLETIGTGVRHLGEAGNRARGAHEIISGASRAALPFAPISLAAAPAATLAGVGTGLIGSIAGNGGARILGADEDTANLVGDVAGIAAGGFGGNPTVRGFSRAMARPLTEPLLRTPGGAFVRGASQAAAEEVPSLFRSASPITHPLKVFPDLISAGRNIWNAGKQGVADLAKPEPITPLKFARFPLWRGLPDTSPEPEPAPTPLLVPKLPSGRMPGSFTRQAEPDVPPIHVLPLSQPRSGEAIHVENAEKLAGRMVDYLSKYGASREMLENATPKQWQQIARGAGESPFSPETQRRIIERLPAGPQQPKPLIAPPSSNLIKNPRALGIARQLADEIIK